MVRRAIVELRKALLCRGRGGGGQLLLHLAGVSRSNLGALTPKQRKLGMDVHNAIGVELLLKQMITEMVMAKEWPGLLWRSKNPQNSL